MLRPACRHCAARRGIAEPVACYLPPHLTVCRRHRSGSAPPPAPTPASWTSARSPRSSAPSGVTSRWCTSTRGSRWTPPSTTPPAIHQASAPAPGSRASGGDCTSWPPAPAIKPWPPCSAPAPAGQTTAQASPSSRSRSTPTSSGSPRAASGRETRHPPVTLDRHEMGSQSVRRSILRLRWSGSRHSAVPRFPRMHGTPRDRRPARNKSRGSAHARSAGRRVLLQLVVRG